MIRNWALSFDSYLQETYTGLMVVIVVDNIWTSPIFTWSAANENELPLITRKMLQEKSIGKINPRLLLSFILYLVVSPCSQMCMIMSIEFKLTMSRYDTIRYMYKLVNVLSKVTTAQIFSLKLVTFSFWA